MIQIRVPKLLPIPKVQGVEYNGKWGIIGRWLYRKLTRPHIDYGHHIKTVTIDVGCIIDAILAQRRAYHEIMNGDAEMIIVGPDAFRELMKLDLPFDIPLVTEAARDMTLDGIPIRFVPWFEGILCVPKAR